MNLECRTCHFIFNEELEKEANYCPICGRKIKRENPEPYAPEQFDED